MSTILVADDDISTLEVCRVLLTTEGFVVLEASSAAACITLARERQPDLILLDWMMPIIDGMDALRALKSNRRTREIPVVMLTALDGLAEINMATYNGADGYVTKPFEAADLISLARRFTQEPMTG